MLTMTVFLATLLYAGLGIVILGVSFFVADKLTPGHLWNEIIETQNVAVAVLTGAIAIGISMIIAAAVHG
jgi:putative membrane protein